VAKPERKKSRSGANVDVASEDVENGENGVRVFKSNQI